MTTKLLDMDRAVPEDWSSRVLGDRILKAQWGNAVMATAALLCTKAITNARSTSLKVHLFGAGIYITRSVATN